MIEKKQQMGETLLMTATINVGSTPQVTIKDDQERLLQYLCALISWIKSPNISTIVFCENSNTSYDFEAIKQFAQNEGKILEVLVFDGNKESQRYGKGYGEGKILDYAINNSKYLTDEVDFYKITGRLFISNFETISQRYTNFPNVFKIKYPDDIKIKLVYVEDFHPIVTNLRIFYKWIERYFISLKTRGLKGPNDPNIWVITNFFKSNVLFFKENLLKSYKRVWDRGIYWLEHAYYDDLMKTDFTELKIDYEIIGRNATNGKVFSADYSDDLKEFAKTFM